MTNIDYILTTCLQTFIVFDQNTHIKQKYDFAKKEGRKKVRLCLNNASNDEKIESVKSYIKLWTDNWFKNPELVKTLNLYG